MIEDHTRNIKLTWRLTINTLVTMFKLAEKLTEEKKYIEASIQVTNLKSTLQEYEDQSIWVGFDQNS